MTYVVSDETLILNSVNQLIYLTYCTWWLLYVMFHQTPTVNKVQQFESK